MDETPAQQEAAAYLRSLLNKTLRIHTPDNRVFVGEFKCTDAERNVILGHTYEYRIPAPPQTSADVEILRSQQGSSQPVADSSKLLLDITPRYLGLVVVPGAHIVRMEIEEFASQVKGRSVPSGETQNLRDGAGNTFPVIPGMNVSVETETRVETVV